jgi:hypothetical protein
MPPSRQALPPTGSLPAGSLVCPSGAKLRYRVLGVANMTHALASAVELAEKLPPEEQDVLAAILLEEIASEQRWSQSFARSEHVLETLAAEALAEFKSGKTRSLDELL